MLAKLVAADEAEGQYFGLSVVVRGDGAWVVVGADAMEHGSWSSYVFDGASAARNWRISWPFGCSVAVNADEAWVVVGCEHGTGLKTSSGSTYVFDLPCPDALAGYSRAVGAT
ncbi:unnamed protein product [Prorocentrum cordatum]|uniref:Uncharacterized protein n=1 Tax=Prorocentrum cordatum TaxID=2364126 RepID=A0ABN9YHS2_9DINO|nr:unnamed protein product [Polarella glacialis]